MVTRMYLTDIDHKVLQFVEEYKAITISECQKIFYNVQNRGYEIARRRLSKLVQYNKLSVYKDMYLNQNVYIMDKKVSAHSIFVLDYYAELIKLGVNFIYFKQEQPWMPTNKKPKYFSDGYACYHFEGKVYFDVIESVRTNSVDVQKYVDIFNSHEAHQLNDEIYQTIGGLPRDEFPRLVVIDNVKHKKPIYVNDDIKVMQLNYKFDNIAKLLV